MASDEALYERLLSGDLGAFDALYARHERPLFGFIRKYLDDPAEAEDVLHDAFLALLRDRKGAAAARNLRAWLFQVARHLCLNRHRSHQRAERAIAQEAGAPEAVNVDPERALADRADQHALGAAVAKLPETLASVYHLRARGHSYEEIAETLELPLGTVKSRMHQLVQTLREELARGM